MTWIQGQSPQEAAETPMPGDGEYGRLSISSLCVLPVRTFYALTALKLRVECRRSSSGAARVVVPTRRAHSYRECKPWISGDSRVRDLSCATLLWRLFVLVGGFSA